MDHCYCCWCFSRLWLNLCGSTGTLCYCFPFAFSCWMGNFKQMQMHIMGGNYFLSLPCVLWRAMSADSVCNWRPVLFVYFIYSIFLKLFLNEEGLNHGIFLQVLGSLRMAVLVVFLCSVLLNTQDMPRGSSATMPLIIKSIFSLHLAFGSFSFTFHLWELTQPYNLTKNSILPWFTKLPFLVPRSAKFEFLVLFSFFTTISLSLAVKVWIQS